MPLGRRRWPSGWLPGWLATWLPLGGLIAMVAACGVMEERDGPGAHITADQVRHLQPRPEPRARYGNHSPYEVYGRQYTVMQSAEGYVRRGVASWYGSKFHGRRTSSGEPYDMYTMTAAHRSLPLPTWVQVTNLDNGRSAVVKVNDRGPFVHDRLLDLSYGAAVVLGVKNAGTARVEVRSISFVDGQAMVAGLHTAAASAPRSAAAQPASRPAQSSAGETGDSASRTASASDSSAVARTRPASLREPLRASRGSQRLFLQLGAFADRHNAYRLRGQLSEAAGLGGVHVSQLLRDDRRLYRVRMGPFASQGALAKAVAELRRAGIDGYRVISE